MALLLVVLVLGACTTARRQPESLGAFISGAIATPPLQHAIWGILIEEEDGRVLHARNPDTLLMPASNRKLFISGFAADCEGLAATIPTAFWIDGDVRDGTLEGDLVIVGDGDPSLGGRLEPDRDVRLRPLFDALRARGIARIRGSVVADVSAFDRETIPGSWQFDDLPYYYAARVDALAFNENVAGVAVDARDCGAIAATTDPAFVESDTELACGEEYAPDFRSDRNNRLQLRGTIGPKERSAVGSALVAIDDPGLYTAQAVDDFLQRSGIAVEGAPRVLTVKKEHRERLVAVESPPMFLLLSTVLKPSQNLYAEMLFKRLGRGAKPASYDEALRLERDFLQSAGIMPDEYRFDDGSGLSVQNLVTPRAIVKLLRHIGHPDRRGAFSLMLATPGEEGTLRRRLAGLETRFRGKTGTIFGVNALSGYLIGSRGNLRYVSIVVNHHAGAGSAALAVIDSIVQKLAEF